MNTPRLSEARPRSKVYSCRASSGQVAGGFGRAAVVLSLVSLFVACKPPASPPSEPPAPAVTVARPVSRSVVEWNEFTGRLDSNENVEIRARVDGYLEAVHFTEGQAVKTGDLLFTIDQRPFLAAVNRAEAALALARAAENLARSNLARAGNLIRTNAISKEEFDLRRSESEQALANVQAAEANLETARLDLGFTEIRSPIDGVAGRHLVNKGNLVNGGSGQSTLLTTVVPQNPIYAYFEMDEASRLAELRRRFKGGSDGEGVPVEMQLGDETGFPHKGVIDFVDNRLNKQTATITVRGRFDNEDGLLTPGLFARVRVPAGEARDAILVPDASIGTIQSLKFVWVVGPDNQARQQEVEPGPLHDGLRIIRSGLVESDRIVTKGIQMVRNNAAVQVAAEENLQPREDGVAEATGTRRRGG